MATKQKDFIDLKEAPLADPEPTSDISSLTATPAVNNGKLNKPEPLGDFSRAPSKALQSVQSGTYKSIFVLIFISYLYHGSYFTESVSNSPLMLTPPCELPPVIQFLPPNLTTLSGQPGKNRRTETDRKIVLYILAADDGHKIEKLALRSIHKELQELCSCRGFELQLCDPHEVGNGNFLDPSCWLNGPLEAQGGHHLAARCLAEISR